MRNYLYLLQVYGAGNPWIHNALQFYGSAENAVKKIMNGDRSVISSKRIPAISAASLENSDKIINSCAEKGIKIITIDDDDYPTLLKNIYNPPTLLFVQGNLAGLDDHLCLATVGPRMPDRYAAKLASVICPGLAACGMVLISGLARGIDQAAHLAAIRAHQPTVAVLACGIDVEYPANTARLRQDIAAGGGAVITELLPGTSCRAGYFKYRNRIISGLANGTLVIGANDTSGSMITARHAAEQNRDLFFTMPSDTLAENVKGIIRYLRDGAIPVYDHYDIISEYYDIYGDRLNTVAADENRTGYITHDRKIITEPPAEFPDEPHEEQKNNEKPKPSGSMNYVEVMPQKYRIRFGFENPDGTLTSKGKEWLGDRSKSTEDKKTDVESSSDIQSLRGRITSLLKEADGGISLDEILKTLNDDFSDVTETLADMEIDGLITCKAGNLYILNE